MKLFATLTRSVFSICLVGWLLAGTQAQGQTFTTLHSLTVAEGSPITGRLLQASDGNFYGTGQQGGSNGVGTFFKITPGGTFSVLHSFDSAAGDGAYPLAGLVQGSDGNFYGTTGSTIFKITPGGALTTLHTLDPGASEGLTPFAPLVQNIDGAFYGSTYQGGIGGTSGSGTIFKLTTNGTAAGTTLTTLYSFAPQVGGVNSDGGNPVGAMVRGGDGNFYGTTFSGGANHRGTIFKITPAGALTTLHVFTAATGGESRGALVLDSSGVFYGTSGLQPQGSVFQVATDGTEAGTAVTTLYSFTGGSDGGGFVAGVVINNDGDLYGVNLLNGANGNGTFFRLTPGGPLATLHAFGASPEEAQPHAGVILGSDGNVYGTTKSTIFKFVPGGTAPPAPPHGGLSETVFKVKKLPPANAGNDSVIHFSALQSGTPESLKVRVQFNTTPNNDAIDWTDLANGSRGYMTLDKTTQKFVLSATNYPLASGIYFRALSTAPSFPESKSNVVGPFNLSAAQNHLGSTVLHLATNGPGAEMKFRSTVATDQATLTLYIQSTLTPDNDTSWVGLNDGRAGQMHPYADPKRAYLDTTNYPPGAQVYFRAVAKAVGFLDSYSNIIGVKNVVVGTPATLQITPLTAPVSGNDGTTAANPLVYNFGTFTFNARLDPNVPFNRFIKKISLFYDGGVIDSRENGAITITTAYTTTVPGDHVIKAIAVDELGIRGFAPPVYIRVKPPGGKIFTMTNSGNWSTASNWLDELGQSGIPGLQDLAIVNGKNASIGSNVTAYAISLLGGEINGTGGTLNVSGLFSVASGALKSVNLVINRNAAMVLSGDENVPMSGDVTNMGTIRVTGRGGIVPVPSVANANQTGDAADGFFDGVAAFFHNVGDFIFHRPNVKPAPATQQTRPPVPVPHGVAASTFQNSGRLITNDGGSLITNDGGSLITHDGGSLIGNDGASLITNDGGSVISNDGASIIGNDGASLITNDGGSRPTGRAPTTAANPGFIQTGGETDLSGIQMVTSIALNGGTLGGSGVIVGSLTNNSGFIAPGHSAGKISVVGNFAQAAGGTLVLEDGGAQSGQRDHIQVDGSANLNGKLVLRTIGGYMPDAADMFSPLGYNTASGSFIGVSANTTLTAGINGLLAQVNPAVPNPTPAKLVNISTRLRVESGDNVLIGGFIVTGSVPKRVIIRAIGPSLPVAGALADPILELHKSDGSVITNDNWRSTQEAEIIATSVPPSNNLESAIVATLSPGAHTAIVRGKNGGMGVGLVEVYDLDTAGAATLVNISTRGRVLTGDDVMIGGVIIQGAEPAKVLIRAIGPSLPVAGALADPMLELHDRNGNVIQNDDWRETQETEIIATTVPPTSNAEAALVVTLVPDAYTAVVRGKNGTTGVALIEAYSLP